MASSSKGRVRVKCEGPGCGKAFEARRADQKFCCATCRQRAGRQLSGGGDSELVKAVKADLRRARKLSTVHGQVAVKIATQLDGAGPSQTASLSRELDRVLALVLGPKPAEPEEKPAEPEAAPEPDDEVTLARRARDAKLAALREAAD